MRRLIIVSEVNCGKERERVSNFQCMYIFGGGAGVLLFLRFQVFDISRRDLGLD